jgi:CHAT domain-containing protein/Tfp pilus assembly protein PilF
MYSTLYTLKCCAYNQPLLRRIYSKNLQSKSNCAALSLLLGLGLAFISNVHAQRPLSLTRSYSVLNQFEDADSLKLGNPIERVITHDSHYYRLDLAAGQFLRVVVEQRGVDLMVRLLDAKGTKRAEVDSPNSAWGSEHLLFVANETGTYRVEVRLLESYLPVGHYRISIAEQRVATEQERSRATAQQRYSQANELLGQGTKESLAKAIPEYEEALRLQKSSNDARGEAATLVQLATVLLYSGEGQKGIDYFTQALPLWRIVRDRAGEAVTLNNLGYAHNNLGSREKAIEYFTQAGKIFRLLGDKREVANISNNIGTAYVNLGEYEKAFSYFNEALPYFQSHKDPTAANILTNLGEVYESRGEYQKALDSLDQALPMLREKGKRRDEANALLVRGTIYHALGKYSQAVRQFTQALQALQELGDRWGEAGALNHIGKTYVLLGEKKKALDYFETALDLARSVKDSSIEGYILNNIGFVRSDLGKPGEALVPLSAALPLMKQTKDLHGEAQTLNYTGRAYTELGDKQRAIDNFNRALTLNRQIKERGDEGNTLGNLMNAWNTFQSPQLAIFYGKQAINTFQEIRTNIQKLNKELQTSFLTSKEKIYRELADILISDGRLSEAQQVLRLLKEEEYFEFIRRDKKEISGLTGRAELTGKEAGWERRHREFADKLIISSKERSELLAKKSRTPKEERRLLQLDSDLSIAREDFQRFLDELINESGKSESAREREFQLKESEGLMEDLRELGTGVVALYTLVGEEKYRVVLVTPDIQKGYEYPIKSSDLNRKVAAFREALEDPDANPLASAQDLYRIIVGPIAKDLNDLHAETLMWSLDGVLRYVPIAALHDGEKYLIESHRNVVFTPASMARLKDVSRNKWRGLGFGVSKTHGDFEALPAVPGELRAIIREESLSRNREGVLPGKLMLDDAFTERGMRLSLRQRYPLVHVASHFQFSPVDESDSFLLLGDGAHFSIEQIKNSVNLFSGVELLTLSACHTAMGGEGSDGKEVEGFGMLAQRKGAKAVIASLWSVADRSTQILMREFYRLRESQSGMSKAEALQKAQIELLRGLNLQKVSNNRKGPRGLILEKNSSSRNQSSTASKSPYSHPFYWAPFILIGNWK